MPPSTATINNLTEHLQWFLRDKPFIPPPFQVPDTPVRSSSRTLVGGNFSSEAEDNAVGSLEQSNSGAASPDVRPELSSHPGARGDPVEIHLSQLSVEEECHLDLSPLQPNSHDMARLRSAPSSATKPRLLATTADCSQLTPPARIPGIYRRASPQRPLPGPSTRTPQTTIREYPDREVDSIDLTGSPTAKARGIGRKRKSDEITGNNRRKRRGTYSSDTDQDGFIAIEDFPDEPPPPYATVNPEQHQPVRSFPIRSSPTKLDTPFQDIHQLPVSVNSNPATVGRRPSVSHATSSADVTRKRKSLSRTHSEIHEHEHKPSKRRTIPDSEDEDLSPVSPIAGRSPASNPPPPSVRGLTQQDREIIEMFLQWSPEDLAQCVNDYKDAQRLEIESCNKIVNIGEIPPPEAFARQKVFKARLDALGHVKLLGESHQRLTKKIGQVREQIKILFSTGEAHENHPLLDENKSLTGRLNHLLVEIITHLRSAGLILEGGQLVKPSGGAKASLIVVKSTQITPMQKSSAQAKALETGDLQSSERIQQTQFVTQASTTPANVSKIYCASQEICFADGRSTESAFAQSRAYETMRSTNFNQRPAPHFPKQSPKKTDDSWRNQSFTAPTANDEQGRFDNLDPDIGEEILFDTNMQSMAPSHHAHHDFDNHFDDFDDDYDEELLIRAEEQAAQESRNRHLPRREASTSDNRTGKTKSSTPGLSLGRTRHSLENHELMQHPWSNDVRRKLLKTFKLKGFRPNQLEAINATLAGKDVFVLMPTGGGKSLCYQLPSLIDSGKTRGVSIVISPLLSLMEDQIAHLGELGVQAFVLNGETTLENKRLLMDALKGPDPQKFIRMLYVTPEMLSKNQSMIREFERLYNRKLLARIIIDEAHCVSQWGHDFRPEYKSLGEVRERFPGVPVMALTATATKNVKVDVIYQLKMRNCEQFKQSFNRPNLSYEVRPKQKQLDVEIAKIINGSYIGKSGIVYCLSRKSCESLAETLREKHQIEAHYYHAGMEPSEKKEVQARWQSGQYQVIVATIAFGMGIDKADVRFVVHNNMPKSLEGYYQETGRAGRDGERSGCYLFFSYSDYYSYKRMINDGEGSKDQKARQYDMVTKVVQFCENKSDCRRQQLLQYFNERFSRQDCHGGCDNCRSTDVFESVDYTTMAQTAVSLILSLDPKNSGQGYSRSPNNFTVKITLIQLMDIFRGSKSPKVKEMMWDKNRYFGAGKEMEREDVERLFHHLVADGAITEFTVMNRAKFPVDFAQSGPRARIYVGPHPPKFVMKSRVSPSRKKPPKLATKPNPTPAVANSTNVSSPVQETFKRRNAQCEQEDDVDSNDGFDTPALVHNGYACDDFVVDDDDDEEDDYLQPVSRGLAHPSRKLLREGGEPITTDLTMDALTQVHKLVVEHFVREGREVCQKIMMSKNLRSQPFTDLVLREMAIHFPADLKALLKIKDINPEMAKLYGPRLLRLVAKTKTDYDQMMRPADYSVVQKPRDPNRETVINLISDDDPEQCASEDSTDGEFDETSSHFPDRSLGSQSKSAEIETVENFNAKYLAQQNNAVVARPTSQTKTSVQGKARHGARRNTPNNSKTGGIKGHRKGSGSFRPNKRKGSGGGKNKGSRDSRGGRGGGSGHGGGGIGMMPV